MQEARILIENGRDAQHVLASFSQERLDDIVEAMAEAVYPHAKESWLSCRLKKRGSEIGKINI